MPALADQESAAVTIDAKMKLADRLIMVRAEALLAGGGAFDPAFKAPAVGAGEPEVVVFEAAVPLVKILLRGSSGESPSNSGQTAGLVATLHAGPSISESVVFILGSPAVPFTLAAMRAHKHCGVFSWIVSRLVQHSLVGTWDVP